MENFHLNEQQQLAVNSTEGKIRVIAGAGTGKTLVLVNRYAYIVNELGVDPDHVLCLTFTNKAAKEMRIRLADKFMAQERLPVDRQPLLTKYLDHTVQEE